MQRRKFIKDTLTGLPIIFLVPNLLLESCKKASAVAPNGKTVIVVGAGISGLIAAQKLVENGFGVTVLESNSKVGGRLSTQRINDVVFDEGASWIHGINGNPIVNLAKKAGMNTAFTDDESRISYDIKGVVRSAAVYDKAEEELYTILESMMNSGNASQSFESVFNNLYPAKSNDRLWKFLLSTYVTFDCGDLDRLSSLLYYEGEEFGGIEKIASNGYDKIANFLVEGLNIELHQRVSEIDYSSSKIKVKHNEIISEADFVLVTVPLGVLKAKAINFSPALPVFKQNAIEKVGMNCVNKFLLVWETAFWDDVQYISYTPEIKDKFNYFVNVKKYQASQNALMTFAYAEYARKTETMSDQQIIDEIMTHLKDMYGTDIPLPKEFYRTNWQSNENTFGSYSYTAVGTEMSHFEDLATSLNDQLFFAGEHTEVDYFSTVHGAYLSGIREANKIIKLV